jgi:putative membrane protein
MVSIYIILIALATSLLREEDGWEAAGHAAEPSWTDIGTRFGPWIFALIMAFVVVRGLMRAQRYSAAKDLSEEDREALRERVAKAESSTSGEIVVVVSSAADDHPDAPWKAGAATLLLGTLLLGGLSRALGPIGFVLVQIGVAGIGYLLAVGLHDFRRSFVRESRATAVCEEQALQELQRLDLTSKPERTAVLLFVSVFEQRVVVIGDTKAHEAAGEDAWVEADAAVLGALRAKGPASETLRDALAQGIDTVGATLARVLPPTNSDRNRFDDSVEIRD